LVIVYVIESAQLVSCPYLAQFDGLTFWLFAWKSPGEIIAITGGPLWEQWLPRVLALYVFQLLREVSVLSAVVVHCSGKYGRDSKYSAREKSEGPAVLVRSTAGGGGIAPFTYKGVTVNGKPVSSPAKDCPIASSLSCQARKSAKHPRRSCEE
jgi:hypothetical protein